MSEAENRESQPLPDLEMVEKTARQVGIEAAGAQKLLNDAVFTGFLAALQEQAANSAIFDENPSIREENRMKVRVIAELRGLLQLAARLPEEIREQTEMGRMFE